ncbi:MAG TPA: DNA-directed RNA polymerase subunit alpha [Kofleriaceae bacterium]|nr:DNA-directed RNA polymerase subunit alpha [Kofleriaceae bacterium]
MDERFIAKNWRDLIRPRELEVVAQSPTHATLRCEPLERGFGTTLGVMLRRTLLSVLPGAAITHVAFDRALPAELDDLTAALTELVFASELSTNAIVRLDRHGPGDVTGADLALVDGVRCCNPEHRICTLAPHASLSLRLSIGLGRGYSPAERHAPDLPEAIAIAAMFAPVSRVEIAVSNARVGQQTDYDRLTLDVWTRGAIDPIEAVSRAATVMRDQLGLFLNFEEGPEPVLTPPDETAARVNENLWRTVEELDLSVRAGNCLRAMEITYIGELVQKTEADLMKSRGFGRKSLTEITGLLAQLDLRLGMKTTGWPGDGSPARDE